MQTDEPDEAQRPLPVPLPDDTWDTAPTRPRHHVHRHRTPPRYLFVGLILAACLALVVLVPILLSSGPDRERSTDDAGGPSVAGTTTATTTGAATTSAAPTTEPAADPTTVDVPAGGEPGGDPVFTPLTYEAEAGALQQAEVVPIDGGSGAQFTDQSGRIVFESVQVPTRGRYQITIVYAADGEWVLELRGFGSAERVELAQTSGCCATATVNVRVAPGGTLSIAVSRGDGPLPTIDHIVIDRA